MNTHNYNQPVLQVGVKVLLKNDQEKYLLVERNTSTYTDVSESWDIVGGRINIGTTLIDNLIREVKEETNLTIVGEPVLIFAQDSILATKHVVRLTYTADCKGEVVLETNENRRYKWLTLEEMKHSEHLDQYLQVVLGKLV